MSSCTCISSNPPPIWQKCVGIAQVQFLSEKIKRFEVFTDTQTSMLFGIPESAICVQRFDDSLNSAIHITYRISLRSSSMREPRDPLLKVVFWISLFIICFRQRLLKDKGWYLSRSSTRVNDSTSKHCTQGGYGFKKCHKTLIVNDPSAGSPTETLLRLLLPLNDQVWTTSQSLAAVASCQSPIRRPH